MRSKTKKAASYCTISNASYVFKPNIFCFGLLYFMCSRDPSPGSQIADINESRMITIRLINLCTLLSHAQSGFITIKCLLVLQLRWLCSWSIFVSESFYFDRGMVLRLSRVFYVIKQNACALSNLSVSTFSFHNSLQDSRDSTPQQLIHAAF